MTIANRPLLAPGFHEITPAQIAKFFLDPLPLSHRRPILVAGLLRYLNDLAATKVKCEVWIDGSFTTDKVEPNDVDLVVVWDRSWQTKLNVEDLARFDHLLDRPRAIRRYQCDVYSAESTDIGMMAYLRGLFGFMRDGRTPKGIGVISL